jgi:hypothetical protein
MILYIDPGTGGAIFQGFFAILAALGGGLAVLVACLLRPVRRFFHRLWRRIRGSERQVELRDTDQIAEKKRSVAS